jgi:hypothetical protein
MQSKYFDYQNATVAELKNYLTSFIEAIPERVNLLIKSVHETNGYEDWQADFTRHSLIRLNEWYASKVETRPRTEEEIQRIKNSVPFEIDIPKYDLSYSTFEIAFYVAVYFSQAMIKQFSALNWHIITKDKRNINYGQPVIGMFGSMYFNPILIMTNIAYDFAKNTVSENKLIKMFDIWTQKLL